MNVVSMASRSGPGRMRSNDSSHHVAALDVGSTKICCLIAEIVTVKDRALGGQKVRQLKVLGVGHHAADGIRGGAVSDLEKAECSIRMAVDAAERMAGITIDSIYVNVSGGRPRSHGYSGEVSLDGREASREDMDRVIRDAAARIEARARVVLHTSPVQYAVDGVRGVRDPIGMCGERLAVDLNAVTVEAGPLRNLTVAIERCHLGINGLVIAPYAAGRSVLVQDEMELGVTCIDMGGGTTSVAVFFEGNLVYADIVPIGGRHITTDIARGLSTPIAHAERVKTLYGSALASVCDDREVIPVPLVGERGTDTVHKIPRSMLTGIIRPRLEETFELIRERLEDSGFARLAGRRVVLTGGASQMSGARELAHQILDRHVRLGFPHPLTGMPDATSGPAFAVGAGLLDYGLRPDVEAVSTPTVQRFESSTYLKRVGRWIRESF